MAIDVVDPPLTLIRQALVDICEALPVENLQGYPYAPSGASGTPLVFVMDPRDDSTGTNEQELELTLSIVVLIQANDDQEGQKGIDQFIAGPASIRQAIRRNRTLGGTCISAKVDTGKSLNKVQIGDYQVWGYEFTVDIMLGSPQLLNATIDSALETITVELGGDMLKIIYDPLAKEEQVLTIGDVDEANGVQGFTTVLANTTVAFTTVEDAAIDANTAKAANANHTGDVTGATALTINPAAISYTEVFSSPVTPWVVNHGLTFTPNVMCLDNDGVRFIPGAIDRVSATILHVYHGAARPGTIYLS